MDKKLVTLRGDVWAARLQGHMSSLPHDIRRWMDENTRLLKVDKYSHCGLLRVGGDLCFLKFYADKSPLHKLADKVRMPKALRSFEAAAALRWEEIPVARPRACLRARGGYLLLTKGIEDSDTLLNLWQGGMQDDLAVHLMRTAGETLAAIHRAGLCHGDCKWSNVLWGGGVLYFIDLDAARPAPPQSRRQARDVARFVVNAEELALDARYVEQFLDGYLRETGDDREELVERLQPQLKKLRGRVFKDYLFPPTPLA